MMGMMDSLLRLLFVCLFCTTAWADFNSDVCLPVETSCGPVPPPLPTNFAMKGEYVDKQEKAKGYEEMYYDFDNLRGKYMMLSEGIELHLIFDYNASQVMKYYILHPGSTTKDDPLSFSCVAEEIAYSEYKNIFGYREGVHGLQNTPMYDSNYVLRYGGPYQYAYSGNSGDDIDDGDQRGLIWNSFNGCIYDREEDMTAQMRYKFSGANLETSGGSVKGDVDGSSSIQLLSVPIGVDYEGEAIITDPETQERKYINVNRSHSFSWFKANPQFDDKNFQIPPWMHCDKYRGWKSMPKFPMAFSMRKELISFSQDMLGKRIAGELVSVDQLHYYNEKGLARRDYTPHREMDSDIFAKFGNLGPVKTVYDYSTLQVYVINKQSGRCYARALELHEFFSTLRDVNYAEMATPEELFLMQQDSMEYKGQYFTRDINCDVWSGKFEDKTLNLTLYKETHMSTNGWHFDADEAVEYGVPVKHSIVINTVEDEFVRTVTETNFFKFKAYTPPLVFFDISECVEKLEHQYFAINLNVPDVKEQNILDTYRYTFLETAQYYLTTVSDLVSPLRIQRISLSISKSGVLLTFAIVEKPGGANIFNPSKGVSVEEAVIQLRKIVDEGNFDITFVNPEDNTDMPITAEPGNFFDWYPGGNMTIATKIRKIAETSPREHGKKHPQVIYEHLVNRDEPLLHADATTTQTPQKAPKKGMSSRALGGLAVGMLLIGVAIGIALMYLYVRKYGRNSDDIAYAMHTTG